MKISAENNIRMTLRFSDEATIKTKMSFADEHKVQMQIESSRGPEGPQGPIGPTGGIGPAGSDGFSPTVKVTSVEGGHSVEITDASGKNSFVVRDGKDGSAAPAQFDTDDTLTFEEGLLRVNTTDKVEADNTLPVTSAAVYTEVGNINALLATI